MQFEIKNTDRWGKVLWLMNAGVEIGVALDFGIRIVHLSCEGMENLYYEQPLDRSDNFTTEKGWILYGGHRMWLAPESDDSYYPDNDPVSYTMLENGVLVEQAEDPWKKEKKSLRICFLEDGGVELYHSFQNTSGDTVTGASWGINTLAGGGTAKISFSGGRGYNPKRVVSLWGYTDLHDPRLTFDKESLTATFLDMPGYLKVGLYSNPGKAVFKNKGQKLTITFDAAAMEDHMDGGCNFELYMCRQFMELETLGTKTEIRPGECASHREVWHLKRI